MDMPGRSYTSGTGYRYSINGQEKTPEIAPNTTTAEFWQYDSRIVRRWNVDPVVKEYESPYATFGGNPIWFADIDGSDTTKPGTAVRDFKFAMNHPNFGPSWGWLYNWLPENKTGDKVVGTMAGVGSAAEGAIVGLKNLVTDPIGTFKTAMDMGHVGRPNATQTQYLIQSANQYSENENAYGSSYANFFFWSKTTTEVASVAIPSVKAFKSPTPFYTADMAAMDYAILESMKPNKPSFKVVSAMESNGKITLDVNGSHFPKNVNSNLGLASATSEKWPLLQCAEPKALNKMINLGMSKSSVSSATFSLRSGYTYRGSTIFSDMQFSSGRIVAPKAPCSNCNSLLQGTKNRR